MEESRVSYEEGRKSGRLDAFLGHRSNVALSSPIPGYTEGYSDGQLEGVNLDGPRVSLEDALREKGLLGTLDRLQRGVISPQQAEGELNGTKKPPLPKLISRDPHLVAAEWKRQGMNRHESWSRWVQRTSLRPGMDAKEWYRIFDIA